MTTRPTTRRTPPVVAAPLAAAASATAFEDEVVGTETVGANADSSRILRVRSALGA